MAFAAFVIAGVLLLGVLPLKLAATWLGAERTGWIVCFFAGIVAGLTSSASSNAADSAVRRRTT